MYSKNTAIHNLQLSQMGVEVLEAVFIGMVWWDGLQGAECVSHAFRAKAVIKLCNATWENKAQTTSTY